MGTNADRDASRRHDLSYAPEDSARDVVLKLKYLRPAFELRQRYHYNNEVSASWNTAPSEGGTQCPTDVYAWPVRHRQVLRYVLPGVREEENLRPARYDIYDVLCPRGVRERQVFAVLGR